MRLLICGSRDLWVPALVTKVVASLANLTNIEEVIQGGAHGVDKAAHCASLTVLKRNSREFRADWNTHGKAAGGIRNQRMLDEGKPTHVVGITVKNITESRGTQDMLSRSKDAGLSYVYLGVINDLTLEQTIDEWVESGCPFFVGDSEEPVYAN